MLNPDKIHRREGSFWVSKTNFDAEVTSQFAWPDPFLVIDSTLRKMLFTAGALNSTDGFIRVAEALAEAGVKHESLNINWAGGPEPIPGELALVTAIAGRDFGFELNVYADTLLSDGQNRQRVSARESATILRDLGVRLLGVGIVQAPNEDAQQRQIEELAAYFEMVHELGMQSTVTLARVGWRDFDSMLAMSNEAIKLGALRMDLMDSSSSLNPEAMKLFIKRYRQGLLKDGPGKDVPVTMHMHDDFGLATAGAIAAATVGASPDVSVAGVSYRCGFAPLEEVVVSLEVLYGVDTGIKVDRLQPLADLVATETGIPLPPLKPLVGGYAYLRHMPGDVLSCLRGGVDQFPSPAACVHPSVIGSKMTWVWDSLSTDANVRALAATLGETLSDTELPQVRAALDGAVATITTYPRWLTAEQATEICREAIAAARQPQPV
jgi:isopropylmalate/homocitrate/citramalate synthase